MISIGKTSQSFNTVISEIRMVSAREVQQRINAQLEADVAAWLHRGYHERRARAGQRQGGAQCQRCGTRRVRRFSRNGHRYQQLVTGMGMLDVWLLRVICECGGSVTIPFSILAPYQRLGDDVVAQIGRGRTWG